jgi:hypothetical protein
MNPFLSKEMALERIRDIRGAARGRRRPEGFRELDDATFTVRALSAHDREAVRVLAALDGRQLPDGPALVAEVDHEVLAALPLGGGKALADPFKPTAHLVEMLELCARQLRARA